MYTYVGNILDGHKTDENDPYSVRDPFYVRAFLVISFLIIFARISEKYSSMTELYLSEIWA